MRFTRKTFTAITALAGIASLGAAFSHAQSADEQEIRRVVTQYYFDGGRAADSSQLRQAFNMARAHMFFVQADTLVDVPIPEYVRRAGANRARADFRPDTNGRRILMVDVTGTAAVAKLEILAPNARLVDYMSLLKVNGRWQIVNKIFDRGAPASRS